MKPSVQHTTNGYSNASAKLLTQSTVALCLTDVFGYTETEKLSAVVAMLKLSSGRSALLVLFLQHSGTVGWWGE